jgi:hypothetical protein
MIVTSRCPVPFIGKEGKLKCTKIRRTFVKIATKYNVFFSVYPKSATVGEQGYKGTGQANKVAGKADCARMRLAFLCGTYWHTGRVQFHCLWGQRYIRSD